MTGAKKKNQISGKNGIVPPFGRVCIVFRRCSMVGVLPPIA